MKRIAIRPVPLILAIYFLVLLAFSVFESVYSTTPSDELLTLFLAPFAVLVINRRWTMKIWGWFAVYAILGAIGAALSPYGGVPQPLSTFVDVILDLKLPLIYFGFVYLMMREPDLAGLLRAVCWVFVLLALLNAPFVLRDVIVHSGSGIYGQPLLTREGAFQPQGLYRQQSESCWREYMGALCATYLYGLRRSSLTLLFVAMLLGFSVFLHLQTKESICLVLFILVYAMGRKFSPAKVLTGGLVGIIVATVLMFATPLGQLISDRFSQFFGSDTYTEQARTMLFLQSFHIAWDFFPIGTGAGSYSSEPSFRLGYSQVYYAYGLSSIWGAGPDSPRFLMDVFWPKIIGQTGALGVFAYGAFLWHIMKWAVRGFFVEGSRSAWLCGSAVLSIFIFSFASNPYTQEYMVVVTAWFAAFARVSYMPAPVKAPAAAPSVRPVERQWTAGSL